MADLKTDTNKPETPPAAPAQTVKVPAATVDARPEVVVKTAPLEPEPEYDPGYSQQTIDEMKAGSDAIARRNRPGRRKDILDVAEANSNAAKDNANRVAK